MIVTSEIKGEGEQRFYSESVSTSQPAEIFLQLSTFFFADDGVYCCSYGLMVAIESTKSRNGKRRVVIVGM